MIAIQGACNVDGDETGGQGQSAQLENIRESAYSEKSLRRKIPGGLPYTGSPGVLKRVIERIPSSEKPAVFNTDFLATVMGSVGGASRPVIPILKATGLLNQSGIPTELYSQFQTDAGRSTAALQALKNGYSEVFRRNQYAHRASDSALTDLIVSVTGLPKTEPIVRYISATFQVFRDEAKQAREDAVAEEAVEVKVAAEHERIAKSSAQHDEKLNLAYNINVALPETTNIEVYNVIFRSLKANLL